jgi:hypothetical protein
MQVTRIVGLAMKLAALILEVLEQQRHDRHSDNRAVISAAAFQQMLALAQDIFDAGHGDSGISLRSQEQVVARRPMATLEESGVRTPVLPRLRIARRESTRESFTRTTISR